MASQTSGAPAAGLGAKLLTILSAAFFALWVPAVYSAPGWLGPVGGGGESRIRQAYSDLFVLIVGAPLWLALGILVVLVWRRGAVARRLAAASALVFAGGGVATIAALQVNETWPGGGAILTLWLLPPLFAIYAWPFRRPTATARACALSAAALLSLATVAFALHDPVDYPQRREAHMQAFLAGLDAVNRADIDKARQWEARLDTFGQQTPLAEWLPYLNSYDSGDPNHQKALSGARVAPGRDDAAIALLGEGEILKLRRMWEFAPVASPALCAAYDRALAKLAATDEMEWTAGELLEAQLGNLRYLAAANCALPVGLPAAQARALKVASVNPGTDRWSTLHSQLTGLPHR